MNLYPSIDNIRDLHQKYVGCSFMLDGEATYIYDAGGSFDRGFSSLNIYLLDNSDRGERTVSGDSIFEFIAPVPGIYKLDSCPNSLFVLQNLDQRTYRGGLRLNSTCEVIEYSEVHQEGHVHNRDSLIAHEVLTKAHYGQLHSPVRQPLTIEILTQGPIHLMDGTICVPVTNSVMGANGKIIIGVTSLNITNALGKKYRASINSLSEILNNLNNTIEAYNRV